MLSAIEVSIFGDLFFILNDMQPQQLNQIIYMSEMFRTRKTLKHLKSYSAFRLFCSEVEQQLRIKLTPVSIDCVITLK